MEQIDSSLSAKVSLDVEIELQPAVQTPHVDESVVFVNATKATMKYDEVTAKFLACGLDESTKNELTSKEDSMGPIVASSPAGTKRGVQTSLGESPPARDDHLQWQVLDADILGNVSSGKRLPKTPASMPYSSIERDIMLIQMSGEATDGDDSDEADEVDEVDEWGGVIFAPKPEGILAKSRCSVRLRTSRLLWNSRRAS